MIIETIVEPEDDGKALRDIMSKKLHMSGLMIKKIKLYGILEVNGEHRRVIDSVKAGDKIFARYDDDSGKLNSDCGIEIIFEDEWFAICNKPQGVVTHPTHGHLDDSLITRLSSETLHPVMRLDRETSGVIAIAKNGYAHNRIVSEGMRKKYVACVYGRFDKKEGTIDLPIKRKENSIMIRVVASDGARSITHYKEIYYDSKADISLVCFELETGRCHQIRVHSLAMGHPLVGDGLYGPLSIDNPKEDILQAKIYDPMIGRQALHAFSLELTHPVTNEVMKFVARMPDDMLGLFEGLSRETCDELLSKSY